MLEFLVLAGYMNCCKPETNSVIDEPAMVSCDYDWQLDRAGHRCGGRSSDSRRGGYDPPGGWNGGRR